MSTKRIKYHNAQTIATKIAGKAFDHLISPLEILRERLARRAYGQLDTIFNFDRLVKYGWAAKRSNLTIEFYKGAVDFFDVEGDASHEDVMLNSEESEFVAPQAWCNHVRMFDKALYEEIFTINETYLPLVAKRNKLQSVLSSQLMGKTASQAIKAWPEAAQFIQDEMCEGETPTMTVPLETLLAKFLPMLPAPQPEEV